MIENRMSIIYAILSLFAIVSLAIPASAGLVGTSTIRAPAVILFNNTGSLTNITLNVTTGNGTVKFISGGGVANSTIDSAITAAEYGSNYAGYNISNYNFVYSIGGPATNVSGPSAGAAMTILAISALKHQKLNSSITMTGTIAPNGQIGEIGGAIDKVSAASADGLKLVLVPAAPSGSVEQSLYLIAQTEYSIHVAQVANISQAYLYFQKPSLAETAENETSLNFTVSYNTSGLPQANLTCSDGCNTTPFSALVNFTINNADNKIANLSSNKLFSGIASQLQEVENESVAIAAKGYFYTSADVSFLNYINAFYLSSYNTSRSAALYSMQTTQNLCSSIVPPQLTQSNYQYILAAEMRQGWGTYTINGTLSGYNESGATTDDVVSSMFSAAQAMAWCNAASYLYNYSYQPSSAVYIVPSVALKDAALSKMDEAARSYSSGVYLSSAKQAYDQGNYAVAIYDSDYSSVLSNASSQYSSPTSTLQNLSISIAQNSIYGSWGTEFAKEALFYVYESKVSTNATKAHYYAQDAYSTASLANAISSDTKLISQNLVQTTSTTTIAPPVVVSQQGMTEHDSRVIMGLLLVLIFLLLVNLVVMCVILLKLSKRSGNTNKGSKRRKRS